MSKKLLTSIFITVWVLKVDCNYNDRAKIRTSNGDLILEPAPGKSIYLRTNGPQSNVFVGDTNLINLTSTISGTSQPISGDVETFSYASDDILRRLQALERRNLEPQDEILRNISALSTRANRLSTRLNRLQRQIDSWMGNQCQLHTCQNGGTCLSLLGDFHCLCPSNWEGRNCELDVNECRNFAGTDLGCQNGADCINQPGSYLCRCKTGWFGTHCTKRKLDCSAGNFEMCGHGTCVPVASGEGIKCICDQGWTTNGSVACLTDIDECDTSLGSRCSTNPKVKCINLPGSFRCEQCPQGYQGDGFACYDIDECAVSNGGCSSMVSCHNTIGSRICGTCPPGYVGDGITCTWRGSCNIDHGGCHPSARCVDSGGGGGVLCECPQGMDGDGVGLHGCYVSTKNGTMGCESDPCGAHGRCHTLRHGYTCFCLRGYTGAHCDIQAETCAINPCKNGGVCRPDETMALGFRCECTAQYTGTLCQQRSHCGSILHAEEGNLVHPLTNTTYTRNSKCAWIIRTVPDKVINVTFTRFNLERSPDCNFDFLQIHDGRSTADPLLGRFCGNEPPKGGNIVSSQHNLYLWFISNSASGSDGFAFHWHSVAPVCGGEVNATLHGTISSPGSPGKYPPNRNCYWHLQTKLSKRIQLHFFQLDLETHDNCSFDYLAIYDGDSQQMSNQPLEKYCSSIQPAPLQSTGPEIVIHFHSDAHGSGKGFQITYAPVEGVPGCGGFFSGDRGEVSSPSYEGSYLNNLLCEYKIRTGQGTQIQLDFKLFNLERSRNCKRDYLKVYDGPSTDSPIMGTYCGNLDRKITLNSTSNIVFMVFKTDRSIGREGFKINYKVLCNFIVRGDSGVIQSPGYPFTYPDNRTCEYVIETGPGKAIQLTFQDFDIEGGSGCQFDNVEIRDGHNQNSTLLGKYCGNSIPPTHISSHNIMYLKFNSDMSQSGGGFYANYTTIDIECGGIYRDPVGTISHPSADGTYKNKQICNWMILAPAGKDIQLTWNRFDIENTESCRADYLELITTDDDNKNSTLGKYCGLKAPPTLTIMSNNLILQFVSDISVKREGFSVTYTFLDTSTCGSTYIQNHGVLYSPGWPQRYSRNLDCTWIIKVTTGQQIKINITEFDVENSNYRTGKCDDFLQLRNGPALSSPLIGEYCGEFNWKSIKTIANSVYIRFHSDFMISGKGFKLEWDSTITGCGGTFDGSTGSISSPHYPENYNENSECFYRIVTNQGSRISMTFLVLELEFLCDDYVEIYDGRDPESPKLGRFCKAHQNRVIETTSNYAFVKFKSDFMMTGKGFLLTYNAICNNNVTGTYGVIESLNYPSSYPVQNCTWTINLPKGNKINISFTDFDIRTYHRWYYRRDYERALTRSSGRNSTCNIDYLLIDEPDLIDHSVKHCTWPNPISSKRNSMQIKLNTNKGSNVPQIHSGFRMEWVSYGCRGHLKKRSGILNKTMSSSDQMECEWLIETPLGTNMILSFTKVYMLETNNCTTDAIEVYNGASESSPLLTKFCHDSATIQSTSNFVLVKLIKNSSLKDLHFAATFNTIYSTCGGYMKTQSGVITSKNYPKNYENNLNCVWTITVPRSHRVAIDFIAADLNNDDDDCDDFIKLYESNIMRTSNYSHIICNSSAQKQFVSKSNTLTVQFVTNKVGTAKGFKANFSMTCGGVITTTENSENGFLTFDNFRSYSNSSCVWTIIAPKLEQKVSLTITHLSLPINYDHRTNQTCPNSYLRVLDGNDENAPLIEEYCGRKVPATIISRGSALTVVLGTHEDRIKGIFSAHYSTADTSCGGSFTSERGVITSPNYPSPYPINADCEWKLKTSPGNKVSINIVMLDIGYSEECNEEYLEIRDHDGAGQLLGLYCGSILPVNTTAASELYIKFRSNNKNPGSGFIIHYEFLHGNDITDLNEGEIASPLYPRPYDGSGEFWWRITSGSQVINIEIDKLLIHTHSETCDDNLSIYDGFDNEAPLLKELCGALHTQSEVIRTSSNAAYIKLTLNEKNEGALFHLRWSQGDTDIDEITQKINCGSNSTNTVLPGSSEHFTTPNYPQHYGDNQNCEWVFKASYGRHLSLSFVLFDIEERDPCSYGDYVSIFTSNVPAEWKPLKEKICVKSEMEQVYNGSSFMKITFTSDFSYTKRGFIAMVKSRCGGFLNDASGEITLDADDFNNLDRNEPHRCDWKVKVQPGRRIMLQFTYFNISNEDNDCQTYVVLHNGESLDSPKLFDGKYCGYAHENRSTMITSGNNVVISYVTSKSKFFQNFILMYSEVQNSCGITSKLEADKTWEIISTPNYPNVPDPHTECNWHFTGPIGEILRVDFIERFDVHKDDDCLEEYVEIRDGSSNLSPSKGRFCGTNPGTIKTTGNTVTINYVTELTEPNNGFKANISIDVCGGVISSWQGEITSPGFPNTIHLPQGTVCEWHIVGKEGHILSITPQNMNLPESESECGTKVTVEELEPESNINEVLKEYCNLMSWDQSAVESSSNKVIVKLYIGTPSSYPTDIKSTGFRLTFTSSPPSCHGELTTSEGYLTSPRYPRESNINFCSWSITVPDQQRRISLEILDSGKYNIYISEGNFDLSIAYKYKFDIVNDTTTFKSSGNKMTINVRNPHDGPFRFRARFSSDEPAVCGGSLLGSTGHLKSLDDEDAYFCTWSYHADPNQADDINKYNTIFITGSVNSSAPSGRKRCLYFDPKLIIQSSFVSNIYSYNKQSITICNAQFSYRIPNQDIKFIAKKNSDKYFYFDLQWKLQPCGNIINVGQTPISVINIPKTFNDTIECAWQLKTTTDLRTEIKLDGAFKLSCVDEFIKINRYDILGFHTIAEYCVDKPQNEPLTILSNSALVEYHMKTPNSTDIKVFARTVSQECGGRYLYPGKISSPNFPKGYSSNLECEWEFVARELGFRVSLQFINRFAIEKATNCTKDAVIVYDWINDNYIEIARLCGRDMPSVINSTYDRLKVILRTDNDINLDGFEASWTTICGGTYNATTTDQYLYSPGYPFYRPSKTCNYKILAPGKRIQIKFIDFDLEGELGSCENDNLTLSFEYYFDIYCGNEIPKPNVMPNEVELVFNSDGSFQRKGFKIAYSIHSCGGQIKKPTVISSGPGDVYYHNANCTWFIEAPKNKTVLLKFVYFHLELSYECDADYLAVYEGPDVVDEKRLALLCSDIKNSTTIQSKGNTMTVKFVSDMYVAQGGFKIDVIFTYAESVGCGGNINIGSSYTLTSPYINSQFFYENFLDCNWNIIAPLDHVIKISFSSFHIASCRDINQTAIGYGKCDCDFIQIKDGIEQDSTVINKYCGHTLPPELVSSGNALGIRLSTDGTITSSGFTATLTVQESVCGSSFINVSSAVQHVKSPGYDTGSIPRSIHCLYNFAAVSSYTLLHIHFDDFDLQSGSTNTVCDKDKVILTSTSDTYSKSLGKNYIRWDNSHTIGYSIYQSYGIFGNGLMSPNEYVICGSKKSIDLYISGPFTMNVITTSDEVPQPLRGVDVEVSEAGFCGRNFTGLYARIVSNYDSSHNDNITDCYTLISVPKNYTISLYFVTADASFITKVYLDVYDGKTKSSNKILSVSDGHSNENPVFSTGNNVLIHNHFEISGNYITYNLNYIATDKGRGCGGYFFGSEGKVTSPLYPGVYRLLKTCEWKLETPHGTRVKLTFETFDLGTDCDNNYVQLVDRADRALSSYCRESPADFTSENNYVKIVFVTNRSNRGTGWVAKFISIV